MPAVYSVKPAAASGLSQGSNRHARSQICRNREKAAGRSSAGQRDNDLWMKSHLRLALALGLAAVPGPRPAAVAAIAAQERVYVSVADNKGKPVAGLTAADFTVAIDDREQEILSVAPAAGPVSIVIITDRLGLEPSYNHFVVHHALSRFVKTVHSALPDSLFALTTFDGPVVRVAGFSSPTGGFNRSIERLATNATAAAMLDALVDACRVMQGATTERRAIFAVFSGYRARHQRRME